MVTSLHIFRDAFRFHEWIISSVCLCIWVCIPNGFQKLVHVTLCICVLHTTSIIFFSPNIYPNFIFNCIKNDKSHGHHVTVCLQHSDWHSNTQHHPFVHTNSLNHPFQLAHSIYHSFVLPHPFPHPFQLAFSILFLCGLKLGCLDFSIED
jgi:hypothetical protein